MKVSTKVSALVSKSVLAKMENAEASIFTSKKAIFIYFSYFELIGLY